MNVSDWVLLGTAFPIMVALFLTWWQSRRIANHLQNGTSKQEIISQRIVSLPRRSDWFVYLWFFIGSIAIIATLFFTNSRSYKAESESTIISVLSIFITFLVAWQIWQTIASRDEIKEARKVADKAKEEVSGVEVRLMREINLALATSYQQFAMVYRDKEIKDLGENGLDKLNLFFSTCYSLKRIIHLSKAQEYKLCDEEIDWIRFLYVQQESNYQYHNTIQTLLGQIEHTDEISKFKELRDCLTEMFPVSEEDIRKHREMNETLRKWNEEQSKKDSL